ncbi:MAG: His/Gly/Thr/Pro-type tRNA ligase C-terminal domain-containing protein [Campylobacterota bacterium]|nr:His/Gly/Thr/Pro-type tRNA ligase C-terminal domain-containing protein [Campylobacterota bacterium]
MATHKRQSTKVEIEYAKKSLKAHLKSADKINARYCAVIGEDELANGEIWIKDLESKEEQKIKVEEWIA